MCYKITLLLDSVDRRVQRLERDEKYCYYTDPNAATFFSIFDSRVFCNATLKSRILVLRI